MNMGETRLKTFQFHRGRCVLATSQEEVAK